MTPRQTALVLGLLISSAACGGEEVANAKANTPDQGLAVRYALSVEEPYGVQPEALQVQMTVEPPADGGEVDIYLPLNFEKAGTGEGVPPLYTHYKLGEVEGGTLAKTAQPVHYRLQFASPDQPAVIHYSVEQPYEGEPTDRYLVFSPAFQPNYWYFPAFTALLMPHCGGTLRVTIDCEHPEGASDWKLVSSAVRDTGPSRNPRSVTFDTTFHELFGNKGSIPIGSAGTAVNFVFGDTEHLRADLPDGPYDLQMNLYGKPDYVDNAADLFALLTKSVTAQRAFWPRIEQDHFLVTFTTYNNQGTDRFGGFRWTNGFSSFIPQRQLGPTTSGALGFKTNLMALCTHEYAHNWLSPTFVQPDQLEELGWLLEGGADFSAEWFVYLTDEEVDLDGYAQRYNRLLAEFYDLAEGPTKARTMSMDALLEVFWDASYYQRQPYLRGFLMFHNWHARIRKHSKGEHSGHDLVRAIVQAGIEEPLDLERVCVIAQDYLPAGIADDIATYWLKDGAEIRPDPDVFGPGFEVVEVDGIPQVRRIPDYQGAGSADWFAR
ncbi:MAG: hypothetical protein VYE77_02440 [Planctomycetota bacterium]|nr:hypothetical protein [Planctomycetota bacterium]